RDTTICKTVTISYLTGVSFTPTISSTNCKQYNFSIQDTNACAIYYWNWGDNSTSIQTSKNSSMSHTYANNGTYTVCMKAVSCYDSTCYKTICKTVTINCSGCYT